MRCKTRKTRTPVLYWSLFGVSRKFQLLTRSCACPDLRWVVWVHTNSLSALQRIVIALYFYFYFDSAEYTFRKYVPFQRFTVTDTC